MFILLTHLLASLTTSLLLAIDSELNPLDHFEISDQKTSINININQFRNQHSKQWRNIKQKDPNSGELISYGGVDWLVFLNYCKEKLHIPIVKNITVESLDGYQSFMDQKTVANPQHFLALEVNDKLKNKIYNKTLKTFFDWRPAYLLIHGSGSSPYQITKFKFNSLLFNNLLLEKNQKDHKGAAVFLKTCAKCHQYKGFGGHKGPHLEFMLKLYPDDNLLKKFLLNPQADRPRQMSAFEGSAEELENLVQFLRTIDSKKD